MLEVKKQLKELCQIFKLGELLSWKTTSEKIKGFKTIVFDTEKEKNLKFYIKN